MCDEPYRFSNSSGMVRAPVWCVSRRVRLASTAHASHEPSTALPMPIHSDARPKAYPFSPAYPMNMTAEKYVVPYANAVISPLMPLPASRKSLTVRLRRRVKYAIAASPARYSTSTR